MEEITFQSIGTTWLIQCHIPIFVENRTQWLDELKHDIATTIEYFDKTFSRFRNDSLVNRLTKEAGTFTFPQEAKELFALYEKMYTISEGLVTPLIGSVLVEAGYDANYSLTPKEKRLPARIWSEVMKYEHPTLTTYEPITLDFGACGKGYIVDRIADVITSHKCTTFTINAGGDIIHRSDNKKPLHVGLEDPDDSQKVVGSATVVNKSICGSATQKRRWSNFHHIMHPQTLVSPVHIKAVWVVADSTAIADAVTTLLFFVHPHLVQAYFNCEYAVIYNDRRVVTSTHFPATWYT